MLRKILALFAMGLLILSCVICVSAEEFDPQRTGAISVTLTEQYEKTPIVGAELRLYHIATVGINTAGGDQTTLCVDDGAIGGCFNGSGNLHNFSVVAQKHTAVRQICANHGLDVAVFNRGRCDRVYIICSNLSHYFICFSFFLIIDFLASRS